MLYFIKCKVTLFVGLYNIRKTIKMFKVNRCSRLLNARHNLVDTSYKYIMYTLS